MKEGTVVLVQDPTTHRGDWRMGKIIGLKKSADGLVRSATVKVGVSRKGDNRADVLERPIHKLVEILAPSEAG